MVDPKQESILERIAIVETHVSSIHKWMEHIDACVDDLKRIIWKATGAVGIIVVVLNILLKGH